MNMKEAVTSAVFKKYATFSGRASRSEYWWFSLAYFLVLIGTMILDNIFGTTYDSQSPDGWITGLFSIAIVSPSLAVWIRRLHDRGHSGWWTLIAFTIIGLIPIFYWSVMPAKEGEEGRENKWGKNPLLDED
jgi:uncharacterized membrane protein YhaH (DUF805 family)